MFKNRKLLRKIQQETKELELKKKELELEKEKLIFIKQQLEDNSPKICISNVYIWKKEGVYNFVYLSVKRQEVIRRIDKAILNGYEYTMCNIFNKSQIYNIYTLFDVDAFNEYNRLNNIKEYIYPIYKINHNLLAYTNKKVPLYVLQQLYYELNNIDINDVVFVKKRQNFTIN